MAKSMKVSATLGELATYEHNDLSLWLTPGSSNPYWASNASFRDDYVIARVGDFAEAEGYTDFGFEEMGKDDWDNVGNDVIKIKVRI